MNLDNLTKLPKGTIVKIGTGSDIPEEARGLVFELIEDAEIKINKENNQKYARCFRCIVIEDPNGWNKDFVHHVVRFGHDEVINISNKLLKNSLKRN